MIRAELSFLVQDPITRFAVTTETPSASTTTIKATTTTVATKPVPPTYIKTTTNEAGTNIVLMPTKAEYPNEAELIRQ